MLPFQGKRWRGQAHARLAGQEVFAIPTLVSRSSAPAAAHAALAYNPALDGLRAVAIALVIFSHAHAPLFDGAFYGVDVFFVLSGFLITSLLLQELGSSGRVDYWRFYRRRFYRLMPALALFLAAYCLLAPWLWPDLTDVYSDALLSLLYLADYGIAFFDSPGTLLHMWSLAVEEHFYLLWPPLLALLVRRMPHGRLWRAIALLLLLAWLWRVLWVVRGQAFYEIFFRFDTRATGLLLGSLLAALVREQPRWFQALRARLPHTLWLVPVAVLLMGQAWDDMNVMVWGMSVVELASAAVLLAVLPPAGGALHDMLSARPLVWVGRLSYGIYLWHYPVVRYLRADLPWQVTVTLGFALSLALAALSYYTLERWALRRRDAAGPQQPHTPAGLPAPPAEGAGPVQVLAPQPLARATAASALQQALACAALGACVQAPARLATSAYSLAHRMSYAPQRAGPRPPPLAPAYMA